MLPQPNRLRRSADLRLVMRRGRRLASPHLVLHVMTRPGNSVPRAGFVVGKAVGNSVKRHRVSRQLRHLVAQRLRELPPDCEIVIRGLAGAVDSDLRGELQSLMQRAGLHA